MSLPDPALPAREPLTGSVKFYARHVILCTGSAGWPAKIELDGGWGQALSEAAAARSADMPRKIKITACATPPHGPGLDLLLFPDRVRYLGLTLADLPVFVADQLVGDRVSARLMHEPLTGHHLFVCTHAARDERCGRCGLPLYARLARELAARGLCNSVTLYQSSHVGGHHLAGNVILYPSGDWYGYVTPDDIPRLLDTCILSDGILPDLWRGRMGEKSSE